MNEHEHASAHISAGEPPHHGHVEAPFTEAELQELHTQDYLAGQRVVGLMLAIFMIGVVLYTWVAINVAGG